MIILDTNVVSEPMKKAGDQNVLEWIDRQDANAVHLTAPSLAELLFGLETLPNGKRKRDLVDIFKTLEERFFSGRILPFDQTAARHYAKLCADTRAKGRQPEIFDAQIAAIALAHNCPVATRDTAPFLAAGVEVINPWAL